MLNVKRTTATAWNAFNSYVIDYANGDKREHGDGDGEEWRW